jgi:hypothetical protein
MSRAPLATVDDVAARLGQTLDPTDPQVLARLGDASEIVRAYAGETWLDDEGDLDDVPDAIPGVVAQMVERAARNPMGVVAEQKTAGPFQQQFSFGADAATRIYMTRNDKMVVRAAVGRTGIGTIATSRGILETPPVTYGEGVYDPTADLLP